jgi:two-component system phosphate regulon sensor histidine kinase PhoR
LKKNIITGVIFLMAVSLLGIIMVQYFWVRNAIEVKEQQFDRVVNDALIEIVKNFDKEKNIYLVKDRLWSRDSNTVITVDHNSNGGASYTYSFQSDSLVWTEGNTLDTDDGNIVVGGKDNTEIRTIKVDGDYEAMISVTSENGKNFRMKTLIELDSLKRDLDDHQYVIISELRDSVEYIFRQKVNEITSKNNKLEEVIEDMVIELKDINENVNPEADIELIKETIKKTMEDKGINLPYEYAVFNPENDTGYLSKSSGFTSKENIEYKTRLYPQNVFYKPELLILTFPDKKAHIYRSVSLLLGGSMLFTLIILFTFFITIRIILRQKKLSEIKTDFINNMTHEFKTPIATISLAADSIQNESVIEKPDRIRYFTNIIQEENKRMNSRVENVLQMSLIDKNDFNFRFEEGNVHDIIYQASKNIELQLTKKEGKLNLHLEAENPVMQIDKTHLFNILTNLLDNALKYSDEVPEINIRTSQRGNVFFISVKDNGIGMEKEVHQKIFEKFFRVSKGDIHNIKGFGLGLSYVKAVILSWGGDIKVHSAPGKGSEFILEIPLNV